MEDFENGGLVSEKLDMVGTDLEMEMTDKINCTNSCNQSAIVQVFSS